MNLEEQIYIRKSCRKYLDDEIDMEIIHDFMSSVKPLNRNIPYHYDILAREEVNVRNRWSAPYYLALYSEKKENFGENIGFVFQQLSLYLQSIGIGTCWVGMDSPKKKNSDFVIAISFGKSGNMNRNIEDFKRKIIDKAKELIQSDNEAEGDCRSLVEKILKTMGKNSLDIINCHYFNDGRRI